MRTTSHLIKTLSLFYMLISLNCHSQTADNSRKGMLLLGSADLNTLVERVEVAADLYNNQNDFDYIIVTGGCGAHNSSICEATEMATRLEENGVPSKLIFKEEKAKTTVQNYTYSRELRKPDGSLLIQSGDELIVVSNHWHAMSVAARFAEYDQVAAKYHIRGNIRPNKSDKADYSNIYDNGLNSGVYSFQYLWPRVDVLSSLEDGKKTQNGFYAYVQEHLYKGTDKLEGMTPVRESDLLPEKGKYDAAYFDEKRNHLYFLQGTDYVAVDTKAGEQLEAGALSDLFQNLPAPWNSGHIEAAFLNPENNQLYLFKGDSFIQVSRRNGKLKNGPIKIREWTTDWPFSWGSGNLDAAFYYHVEEKLVLFRGQEYLKMSLGKQPRVEKGFPRRLKLEKPGKL